MVADSDDEPLRAAADGVPPEYALQGFDGVQAFGAPEASRQTLTHGARLHRAGPPAASSSPAVSGRRGTSLIEPPAAVGLQGAGTVHHIAWCDRDAEHDAWREHLRSFGAHPTT